MTNKTIGLGLILAAALALAGCSRNEYSMKGPPPPAPKNPKVAHRIEKQSGTGMNAMPAPPADDQQGQDQASASGGEAKVVTGTVEIPPALKAAFKPGETLFVIARATGGGATPVAAKKIVVKAFPVDFRLGQSDSMMGGTLPEKMEILVKLDSDGNRSTNDPGDMLGGPVAATLGGTVSITLRKEKQ